MSRLIDTETGFTTLFHQHGDGSCTVEKKSNVIGAILEANKRQKNDVSGRMGEFVHVARVDPVVVERWCREDGINYLSKENRKAFLKKLHERDNSLFKVHPGKFV